MTPEEAVDNLLKSDVNRYAKDSVRRPLLAKLFESVASTAHDNETRRCERVARMQSNFAARDYRTKMFAKATHVPSGKHLCDMIADEILRTGGLEVDE